MPVASSSGGPSTVPPSGRITRAHGSVDSQAARPTAPIGHASAASQSGSEEAQRQLLRLLDEIEDLAPSLSEATLHDAAARVKSSATPLRQHLASYLPLPRSTRPCPG